MDALQALVTSTARAKVLTALFSERGRSFYQNELSRVTELPLLAVQRELRRLVAGGLVRQDVIAGRRVYAADERSSIYGELSAIVRKLRGPNASIRDVLARRAVDIAFVFGSFAEGTATAASDVDLMIIGDDSPRAIRSALGRVERELRRSVNEHVFSSADWTARLRKGDPFLRHVRGGPKLWVTGDEARLAALDPAAARR